MLRYRKDSFITHRAFCDALAEESSRFSSIAASSFDFTNESHMKSGLPHGFVSRGAIQDIAGLAQLGGPTTMQPDSMVQQKSRLSIWLNNQASPDPLNNAGSNHFGLSGSTTMLENVVLSPSLLTGFGSYGQLFPSANISLSSPLEGPKENDHNPPCQPKPAMSATALLQKAAQMGSTRSNPSSIFDNTFGVMSFSSNNDQGSGRLVDHSSLTRDFLGMGRDSGSPFLPQELARLATMRSAMGLDQFGSSN